VVYGYRYGSPRGQVREALARGQDVIVRVDVQGAAAIRRLAPNALFLFLAPGSMDELERRLRRRDGSDADIRVRLTTARGEMDRRSRFDHVVVNQEGRLDETVQRIVEIVEAERRREGRRPVRI
jgi:guanylate kinase